MKWLIALGLMVLASMVQAHVQPLCESYFTYHNGSCYRFSSGESYTQTGARIRLEGMPFAQANTYCRRLHPDAHLVVINDAAEQEFIFDMFYGMEPTETWIGLFYNVTSMMWEWVNGDPATYIPWEPYYGEPLVTTGGAALMFLSEIITQQTTLKYGYGIEISDYFNTELGEEPFPFICEYKVGMMEQNTTTVDTGNTTTTNTTTNSTTSTYTTAAPPATTRPATMAPQVLYQQEARPQRLSAPGRFGFLREVTAEERRRAYNAYNGPMAYKQRGAQRNGYPYMAMP